MPVNNSNESIYKDTIALVVGVEKYKEPIWDFAGPANDAIRFVNWLLERKVPENNIRLFLSPLKEPEPSIKVNSSTIRSEPASDNVIKEAILDWFCTTEASMSYFFWSGHGFITNLDGHQKRWLLFEDTVSKSMRCLEFSNLIEVMRTNLFKKIERQVFFIDACAIIPDIHIQSHEPKGLSFITGEILHPGIKQFQLYAAYYGKRTISKGKHGIFSKILLDQLENQPKTQWPPDLDSISSVVRSEMSKEDPALHPCFISIDWNGNCDQIGDPYNRSLNLNGLVNKISEFLRYADLETAFRDSFPAYAYQFDSFPIETEPSKVFYKCFEILAKYRENPLTKVYPMLKFIKYISLQCLEKKQYESFKDAFNEWIVYAISDLYDKPDWKSILESLEALKLPVSNKEEEKKYLGIRIFPSTINRYNLESWVYDEEGMICTVDAQSLEEIKLKHIPDIQAKATKGHRSDQIIINFFLPRPLITEDVDQWRTEEDKNSLTLGSKHIVIVRSYERSHRYKEEPFLELVKRTNLLGKGINSVKVCSSIDSTTAACMINPDIKDIATLNKNLNIAEKLVLVLLEQEPDSTHHENKNDVLNYILKSGIPIIMWLRNLNNDICGSVLSKFIEALEKQKLKDLPSHIFELRKKAFNDSNDYCLGNNITLIWDDPDRLPPENRSHFKILLALKTIFKKTGG